MFHDRADAGRQLLAKLGERDPAETVVIALPRGGVPVAEIIAEGHPCCVEFRPRCCHLEPGILERADYPA